MYQIELLPPRRSKQVGAKKISNLYGICPNTTIETTTTAASTSTAETLQTKRKVRINNKQSEREDKDWEEPSYNTCESEDDDVVVGSSSSDTDVSSGEQSTVHDQREEMEAPESTSRQQMRPSDPHWSNSPDSNTKREIVKREKIFIATRHEPRYTKLIDDTSIKIKRK
jgi:hypothetical protein